MSEYGNVLMVSGDALNDPARLPVLFERFTGNVVDVCREHAGTTVGDLTVTCATGRFGESLRAVGWIFTPRDAS